MDLYHDGDITIEDLEKIMIYDISAMKLYREFITYMDKTELIPIVREEVDPFLQYIKSRKENSKN